MALLLFFTLLLEPCTQSNARADLAGCGRSIFLDNFLDEVYLSGFDVDDAALALQKALELRRKNVALEIE